MIFLNNPNQMVFVIDKQFVLCKVGNKLLNINFTKLQLQITCVLVYLCMQRDLYFMLCK